MSKSPSAIIAIITTLATAACGADAVPSLLELEVHFGTPKGSVFQIEASQDLKTWARSPEIHFGDGTSKAFSFQRDKTAPNTYYRFASQVEPVLGKAPWHLTPSTLKTFSQTAGNLGNIAVLPNGECRLALETTSEAAVTSFEFTRTGLDTAELQTPTQGKLALQWFNSGLGAYTLRRPSGEVRRGSFTSAALTNAPESHEALCFVFTSGLQTQFLRPAEVGCVLTKSNKDIIPPVITYQLDAATAMMTLLFDAKTSDTYELVYTSATGGKFTRREIRNEVLQGIVAGAFSLN